MGEFQEFGKRLDARFKKIEEDMTVIIGNPVQIPFALPNVLLTGLGEKILDVDVSGLSGHTRHSPITTVNGKTYMGYLNTDDGMSIAMSTGTLASQTTAIVYNRAIDNDDHGQVSVGVDKDEFIHLIGNLHNSPRQHDSTENPDHWRDPWQYFVSDVAGSISGGWSFRGRQDDIPNRSPAGCFITYPRFARSRINKFLFVAGRDELTDGAPNESDNHQKASIQRYDVDDLKWTILGGEVDWNGSNTENFRDGVTSPLAMFHSNTRGTAGGTYQPGMPNMFFGKNNRLHISCVWQDATGEGSGRHTHLFYIYSDNPEAINPADIVFRNAGSEVMTLPVTPLSSPSATVFGREYTSDLNNFVEWHTRCCVDPNGNPIIQFEQENPDSRRFVRHKDDAWEAPVAFTGRTWITSNDVGVITFAGDNATLNRSNALSTPIDPVNDFTSIAVTPDFSNVSSGGDASKSIVDATYQDDTGDLILRVLDESGPVEKQQAWLFKSAA